MISCRRCSELLVDFLEGDLCDEDHRRILRHLGGCPPCLHFIETYKKTSSLCRHALLQQAPAELEHELLDFLRQATSQSAQTRPS